MIPYLTAHLNKFIGRTTDSCQRFGCRSFESHECSVRRLLEIRLRLQDTFLGTRGLALGK